MKFDFKNIVENKKDINQIWKKISVKEPLIEKAKNTVKEIFNVGSLVNNLMMSFGGVESTPFVFRNRKKQMIEGMLFRPYNKENLPLVPMDAGLRTGVFELPYIATYIATMGYCVFGVKSKAEVMGEEKEDYLDAIHFMKKFKPFSFVGNKVLPFGISSGGAAVSLNLAADEEAVKEYNIVGAIAANTYADLLGMWNYANRYTATHDPNDHRTKVLLSYLNYAKELNMNPFNHPEVFWKSSPLNFVEKINVPVLLIHGIEDQIVPVEQSIILYEKMKELGKNVQLKLVYGEGVHAPPVEMITELSDFIGILQTIASIKQFMKEYLG